MPELPDIDVYVDVLTRKLVHDAVAEIRVANPFLLRSVDPPLSAFEGLVVTDVRRIGKRVAIGVDEDLWLVLHLMVAGRLHWQDKRPMLAGKNRLAAFDFVGGSLLLTESGSKKRASLHAVRGVEALTDHDPGGIEPLECSRDEFLSALRRENHTLKRTLTDPRIFAGIGNAYSDEILHAAGLSPVLLSQKLDDLQAERLFDATRSTLTAWRTRLLAEAGGEMPARVTAFRDGMAAHGRFGQPCPVCGQPIQRIRYKSNETNYCAGCQTGGRLLKDRSLSRLLKADWPRTLDEL